MSAIAPTSVRELEPIPSRREVREAREARGPRAAATESPVDDETGASRVWFAFHRWMTTPATPDDFVLA